MFGPGKIDGEWGYFTERSRERYLSRMGEEFDGHWERTMGVREVDPIYTTYTVRREDARFVGELPEDKEEQAKLKSMPYTGFAELVAERYHTTERFLAVLNPDVSIWNLSPGDTVVVPNVTPFRIESVRHSGKVPAPSGAASRRIRIDTGERYLDVWEGEELLATFPITPGSPSLPAPQGDWRIVGVATMPWFRYDEGVLKRGERTEEFWLLPAGPNNPVGVLWMGLNKPGIGIHGTNNPFTIGRAGSHGCIRLSNWNAARMPSLVGKGTRVRID